MKKYIRVLFPVLLFCILSCSKRQNILFNQNLIKSISEENKDFPSRFFNYLFFCKCQDEGITILDVYELREIHLNQSKHLSYDSFLTELLNQRLAIHCNEQSVKFKINEEVQKKYLTMNFKNFVNFYCTKINGDRFWLKKDITDDDRNTILYFLFVNNYLTSTDDYSGSFVIQSHPI